MSLSKRYYVSDVKTHKERFSPSRCNRGVSKVSTKSKEFLLKFVNRLIKTVLFFIKKICCFGMNLSEISM